MFTFKSENYTDFFYGIISRSVLKRRKIYPFRLWGEDLIMVWNGGNPKCFQNFCPHYGLPLDQGKIVGDRIQCGFHGWTFAMGDGALVDAPLAKSAPKCALKEYPTYSRGNIIFVYPGAAENMEKAKDYILKHIPDHCFTNSAVYEVPFYLAMNSSMDYPHHAFHTLFYQIYGIYRRIFGYKNPLLTTYTPELIEDDPYHFKFRIDENKTETTVHPFCSEYYDTQTGNRWQMFIRPIDNVTSQYMITLSTDRGSALFKLISAITFKTVIRHLAMVEDQRWLKTSLPAWQRGTNIHLSDHDFGLKNYMRKFFIHAKTGHAGSGHMPYKQSTETD